MLEWICKHVKAKKYPRLFQKLEKTQPTLYSEQKFTYHNSTVVGRYILTLHYKLNLNQINLFSTINYLVPRSRTHKSQLHPTQSNPCSAAQQEQDRQRLADYRATCRLALWHWGVIAPANAPEMGRCVMWGPSSQVVSL